MERSVDLDLRFLTAGEIEIAYIVGSEQHLLNNGCYVKQTHLVVKLLEKFRKKAGKDLSR